MNLQRAMPQETIGAVRAAPSTISTCTNGGEWTVRLSEALYTGKKKDLVHEAANAKMIQTGKSSIPAVYGGISTSWTFFGVDLSAQFAYQIGGWTLDSNYQSLMSGGSA